jgi:Na+-translocating ferredoxin:NAD+ oxidoreductase subunit B
MNFVSIIYAVLSLGLIGLVLGILLGYASKKFEVKVDERIPKIKEVLPGANCGACGFPGCDAYATAIIEEGASISACPIGGAACASKIGEIVGAEVEAAVDGEQEKLVAFVKCAGSCSAKKIQGDLQGVGTCLEASQLEGVEGCSYGCLGLGCCVKACKFGAISVVDGVAIVDEEKCVSCRACVKACPKALIEMVPVDKDYRVACSSKDIGKTTRENCSKGCIACKICEKNCPSAAIAVSDNIAAVDYEKCTRCGICAAKCPVKVITGAPVKQAV